MRSIILIAVVLSLAVGLFGCRFGGDTQPVEPTENVTDPISTAPTEPVITEPIIIDPTVAPNVPDEDVDDSHLMDPTDGNTEGGQ